MNCAYCHYPLLIPELAAAWRRLADDKDNPLSVKVECSHCNAICLVRIEHVSPPTISAKQIEQIRNRNT